MSKKPALCPVCGKTFATFWTMSRHKNKIHKFPPPAIELYTEFIENKKVEEIRTESLAIERDVANLSLELIQSDMEELQKKIVKLESQIIGLRLYMPELIHRKISEIIDIGEDGYDKEGRIY